MTTFERPPSAEIVKNAQEQFLLSEIPRQFDQQRKSLSAVGLLELIPTSEDDLVIELQEGIIGMDGKAYRLPSSEEIVKHFSAERYKEKISQGFTKLLVVPFGYPLATILARYAEALLKHHKAGKLLDRDGNKLKLDESHPMYVREHLDKADETGDMVYYPKQFDTANHGGKTKQELLNDPTQPFHGFHVLLIKPDLTIPQQGHEKTTVTRTDLAAGMSSEEYLTTIQTQPQYRQEQGMTLEDSLILALTTLHETNKLIDTHENNIEPVNFNIGNFHKPSGNVPYSNWRRIYRQVGVSACDPGDRFRICGARVAVG